MARTLPARSIPVLVAFVALAGCAAPFAGLDLGRSPAVETRETAATEPATGASSVGVLTLGILETRRDTAVIVTPAVLSVRAGGTGGILIDSPYGLERDARQSVIDAARAAALAAGVDATAYDYTVTLDRETGPMGGPSAGSQFALGFYVALHNLLRPGDRLDVLDGYAGTGTVSARGGIGEVGGVPEKAEAVADRGGNLFAYPESVWHDLSGEMDGVCADLALRCVQVETLADLIAVATAAA